MRQVDPGASGGLVVIVPTYDERETLEELVAQIALAAPEAHVLVVDDASRDGTGALADRLARDNSRVHVLHRPGKLGLGTAYVDGFRWALGEGFGRIGQMDADLSHDPRDLVRLAAALDEGAGLAIGSRNVLGGGVLGWGLGRHVLSKGGSLYARAVLGAGARDMTSGFKLWTRAALVAIEPETVGSNGYAFQIETTFRAEKRGVEVVEVPIVFTDRRVGQSKMSERIFAEAVVGVVRMRLAAMLSA
jgi:dolichol-phosphate mannosyltransferase